MSVTTNAEQELAVKLAVEGHSFLLTGGAGTGKTFTLQQIVRQMKGNIVICASTGLSSLILGERLPGHSAQTVHSTFGLMDGRYSAGDLVKLFSGEDDYYISRRKILQKADCIIIDEISMISSHILHKMNCIMQLCKDSKNVMGGVQRIFCGDFLQLPPIQNDLTGDTGEPAIMSTRFDSYVPHKIVLTQIQRASDATLCQAIREVSCGNVSSETMAFLKSKTAPLGVPEGQKLVLFGQRFNVEMHNAECLARHPGQLYSYLAKDEPSAASKQLRYIVADKKLMLKIGVPVMLIKNVTNKLVNGLRGRVAALYEERVDVNFPSLSQTHSFKPEVFTRFDSAGRVTCKRVQIPMVLCYATTVHKSQGTSADFVEVHVEDMHYPGLITVAISRVRSAAGLRITGFTPRCPMAPDKALCEKINEAGRPTESSVTKCCTIRDSAFNDADLDVYFSDSEDEEFLCTPPLAAHHPEQQTTSALNDDNIIQLLSEQIEPEPITHRHKLKNENVKFLQQSYDLSDIYQHLREKLDSIYGSTILGNVRPNRANGEIFNQFKAKSYSFLTTDLSSYLVQSPLSSMYHPHIKQLFMDMSARMMTVQARKLGEATISSQYSNNILPSSSAGKGTIRRIGGRTLYLIRKELIRKIRTVYHDVFSNDYKLLRDLSKCIQLMITNVADVQSGKYPETVNETERRNYGRGGLLHITDETFELFMALETSRQALQSVGAALLEGRNVLKNSFLALQHDENLITQLYGIIPSTLSQDKNLMNSLWNYVLQKYLPVGNNTFRKTILSTLQKNKSVAHRPSIAAKGETVSAKRAKLLEKGADAVDSECRAKGCKVLKSKKGGTIRWIACSSCCDWHHLDCTNIQPSLTDGELHEMQWNCMHCCQAQENQ